MLGGAGPPPGGEEGGEHARLSFPCGVLGLHTRYNGRYKGAQWGNPEQILKSGLSSDWGLQLDPMKLESLVIVGQPHNGEYVLKPCTHRPSTQGSWEGPKLILAMVQGKLNDKE